MNSNLGYFYAVFTEISQKKPWHESLYILLSLILLYSFVIFIYYILF